jgi:hypothetical protein
MRASCSHAYSGSGIHSHILPALSKSPELFAPTPFLLASIVLEKEELFLFGFLWSPHPDQEISLPLAWPRSAANFGDSARTV